MTTQLGCIVSPYLRPMIQHGRLVLDNAVAGTVHELTTVQERLVRALWAPADTDRLDALVAEHGMDSTTDALCALLDCGVLFQTMADCEAWFAARLEASFPQIPFVDQVELTNSCPMRCKFCPRGVAGGITRPTGFMPLELFVLLLGQLHPKQPSYRPIELHHLGESLLHPHVVRFVAEAAGRGLPTEMSVNPSLLTPPLARALLDAGLSRIVLSLDGMDDATLAQLRGPVACYSKAEANLVALLDHVASMQRPPMVVIQMLELHRNRHQRESFLSRWGASGLPTVQAFVKDLDGPDPDLGHGSARPTRYLCTFPWRSVVVLWDGRVVACCRDADGEAVLGNLHEQRLDEIWHGGQATALRDNLRARAFEAGHPCAACGWRPDHFAAAMQERHPERATLNPLQW